MIQIQQKSMMAAFAAAATIGLSFQVTRVISRAQSNDAAMIAKAKAIHARVLKLDTHNDIDPANFTADCNYTMHLTTQVNLPKMVEGGMDVSFMIACVGQAPLTQERYENAYRQAVAKFDAIHRLTETISPDRIGLALTPADVLALHKKNLRVAVIGIENGYPIGTALRRVKEFYDRGGRYMSLAHNGNSQRADSNTGETQGYLYNNGLSPLGQEVIVGMNRLGVMIDLSHPSKGANLEAMRLSQAPIIASHSGVRALANVSRNMDDEQLLALEKNGGVIQVVGFASYIKPDAPERIDALAKLRQDFGLPTFGRQRAGNGMGGGPARASDSEAAASSERVCPVESASGSTAQSRRARGGGLATLGIDTLSPEQREDYTKKLAELDAKWPPARRANVSDFVNHIDYAVKLIGIDHVGIASDFDDGGIDGWDSAAEAFNVRLELVRRGCTDEQIGKLWSGNLLRVRGEVEKVAQKLKKEQS